jgi:hypothetical protein
MKMLVNRPIRLLLCVMFCASAVARAQRHDSGHPYMIRGHQVEAVERALTARAQRFHDSLAVALTRHAPDLLQRLEPPPPIATGYQLLPRILPDTSPMVVPTRLQIVSYGWKWSETLMQRELDVLVRLDSVTQGARRHPSQALFDSIVTEYRGMIDRKRLVDADVNYNWLWQTEIDNTPEPFREATRLSDALLARQNTLASIVDSVINEALALDVWRTTVPSFVRFTEREGGWTITVPLLTDIQDSAFLGEFKSAVEDNWRAAANGVTYAVKLDLTMIAPESLYCRNAPPARQCIAPRRGSAIDLAAHIARFPAGIAVLTTGGGSTHVAAGRAIVVSPHDAPRRMIAHEFGHLLGFRDGYLRGFQDAGADGYIVTELVVDAADIMGSHRTGAVRVSHFERLMAAKDVPVVMQRGLDALYVRRDAPAAEQEFRRVLSLDPAHYGANYQLAKTLDLLGRRDTATAQWQRVLRMALAINDQETAATARKRLSP